MDLNMELRIMIIDCILFVVILLMLMMYKKEKLVMLKMVDEERPIMLMMYQTLLIETMTKKEVLFTYQLIFVGEKTMRNSIDNICNELSVRKSSIVVNIGQNIVRYLEKCREKRKKFHWLPEEIYDLICKCLGEDEHMNNEIIVELASIFNMKRKDLCEKLHAHINKSYIKRAGNRSLSNLVKSMIHDEWLENSIPSDDRHLGRNKVVLHMKDYQKRYGGIQMKKDIVRGVQRGIDVVVAERHIATCSTEKVMKNVFLKYNNKVSRGSVENYRPFFVGNATDREIALCQCKCCLNLRKTFEAMNDVSKDLGKMYYDFISYYFMANCNCPKNPILYWDYKCCNGICPHCVDCAITKLDANDPNILATYNNFVIQKVPYVVTRGPDKGKTKITTRCDRETFKKKFSELNMAVDNSRSWYILHRYLVQHARFVFQMFQESIVDYGDIFWVDMSENLANTQKDQCQDAHFNQRQSSLCCTVQIGADDNTFHYHFSDYNTQYHWCCIRSLILVEQENNGISCQVRQLC